MSTDKLPNEGDTVLIRGRRYEYSELLSGKQLYVIDRVERDGDGHGKHFTLDVLEVHQLRNGWLTR